MVFLTCFRRLALGFSLSLAIGLAIRYFNIFGKLVLPLVTHVGTDFARCMDPSCGFHSWHRQSAGLSRLHRDLLRHGTRDFVADRQCPCNIQLARIMGCSKRQIYRHVILPTILPDLFVTLRMNLFAAGWWC